MDKIRQRPPFSHLYHSYPAVAAVVTVKRGDVMNAMACAWHSPLSFNPPLYGVLLTPRRFSYALILEAGAFGVNFLPFEKADLIAGVGRNSGRDLDKFATFAIAVESESLAESRAPILKEAYAAYECRLMEHRPYGDHELFVGEILSVYQAAQAFDEEGVLQVSRFSPALYLGADLYTTASNQAPLRQRGTRP
jgi:flavin reductase (DIM6/NTAB) family NADH-FMN oxidoreductase RutF